MIHDDETLKCILLWNVNIGMIHDDQTLKCILLWNVNIGMIHNDMPLKCTLLWNVRVSQPCSVSRLQGQGRSMWEGFAANQIGGGT